MKCRLYFLTAAILLTITSAGWSACPEKPVKHSGQDRIAATEELWSVERVFPHLDFWQLTNLAQPKDDSDGLFVTEQGGLVRLFPNRADASNAMVFLDISDRVKSGHNEEGLLGIAFDPAYKDNGFFYLHYSASDPRRSVISRFSVQGSELGLADPESELVILEVPQPAGNHNGGQLAFGPDGYLYIGLGDGGWGGDPQGNGQNTATLLGAILRIDVSGARVGKTYRIPLDNPLVSTEGARGEIFAYGLRNPWRFSFDILPGPVCHGDSAKAMVNGSVEIWAGDVGQNRWEEINLVRTGRNYGWKVMEGSGCYFPKDGCLATGLELPVHEYGREGGCSVTGGYVYRGSRLPALIGTYVFGDFCSGRIWGLGYDGISVTYKGLLADSGLNITSFGQDSAGELYILSRDGGIYQFSEPGSAD